jgi:hypothetical protein
VEPHEQQVGRDQARRIAEATEPGELSRAIGDVCEEITHGIPFVSLTDRSDLTTRLTALLEGTALAIRQAALLVAAAERKALAPSQRPGAKGRKKMR